MHGAYKHSRGREEVGSGAASRARILEQGLALDELVEMKTSIERGAQGESGGDHSPSTEGAAGRDAVPLSSELSDGEGVAARWESGLHAGRMVSLRKLGSTAAADSPRWEYNRRHPRRA